jgi:phenylacetate-CoA ligase
MRTVWDYLFNEETGIGTALTILFYRKYYQETYRFLSESQWWTDAQIKNYQWSQLKTLLHHAYDHVPYYKKLFDAQGITPQSIRSFHDFQALPFLTKELVQEHTDELKATNYPASAFEETITGGSTGFPLRFYVERGVWYARHLAYIRTLLMREDCQALDKSVQITGSIKPWEYRPLSRTLVLSSFHMTDQNLPIYIKKITRLQPHYIIGYPSAITLLATYRKKNNIELKRLRSIFCYGETVYDWQKEFLEQFFHCRVHGQYGHREQSVLAGTCEKSSSYHLFPEYGFIELIDRNGKPVTKDGESGEIVATGFHTGIFPFIRYKTGDIAVYSTHQCECGRHYPLLKSIEGRQQDFVVSKTRRLVPFMGVHHLVATSTPYVKECQLIQESQGEIIISIVKKEGFSDSDMRIIQENFHKRFGDEFVITFNFVDSIPRTIRGKYQFLIQKLPVNFQSKTNEK